MKVHNRFIKFFVAVVIALNISASLFALDFKYEDECGYSFSLTLPDEISYVWDGMEENDPILKKVGAPPKEQAVAQLREEGIQIVGFKFDGQNLANLTVAFHPWSVSSVEDKLLPKLIESPYPIKFKTQKYSTEKFNGTKFLKFTYSETYMGMTMDGLHYYTKFGDSNCLEISIYTQQQQSTHDEAYAKDNLAFMDKIMKSTVINVDDSGTGGSGTSAKKPLYKRITSFTFPLWIIAVALLVLLLWKASPAKLHEWKEDGWSLESSKCIQGFCAVAIIIHHLSQKLAETRPLGAFGIFTELGVIFVGVFFFFSGYGLIKSLLSKENYLSGFFKKRLPAVLVPFYACILVFIFSAFVKGESFSPLEFIGVLSGFFLYNTHMWYIVEIVLLYVAFYLCFRFIKKQNAALAVMGIFIAAFTVVSLYLGHGDLWFQGEWWYNTTMLFFIGMLIAKNEAPVIRFIRKWYALVLPLCLVLAVALFMGTSFALQHYSYWAEWEGHPGYKEKFICLAFQLPMVIFAVFSILLIMQKVSFKNRVLKFLGTISLELYLIHNLILEGLNDGSIAKITGPALYIVLTILIAVALATVINRSDRYVIALMKNGYAGRKLVEGESIGKIHSIDFMRLVMALFVVAIHIPFGGWAGNGVIAFGKTAVPFFLVVCGYLLYRDDNKEFMARLKKQTLRILLLTIFANVLYTAFYAVLNLISRGNIKEFLSMLTVKNLKDFLLYNMLPYSEHLWFLGSLLYALLIMMFLCKTKLHKAVMFTAPALLVVYVVLSWVGKAPYYKYRNALIVTLPYLMMGCLVRRYQFKLLKIKPAVLWSAFAVLIATTFVELYCYGGVEKPFVSAELLIYVLMLLCLNYPDFGKDTFVARLGSSCSLFVYIAHIIPLLLFRYFFKGAEGFITNYGPITIFVITLLVAALYKKCISIHNRRTAGNNPASN